MNDEDYLVTLNNGTQLYLTARLHEDEVSVAGGVWPEMRSVAEDGEEMSGTAYIQDSDDEIMLWETLKVHELAMEILVRTGCCTKDNVDDAYLDAIKHLDEYNAEQRRLNR